MACVNFCNDSTFRVELKQNLEQLFSKCLQTLNVRKNNVCITEHKQLSFNSEKPPQSEKTGLYKET